MSFFDRIWPACKLCGKFKTDRVISVPEYGDYGGVSSYAPWRYHDQCLVDVLANPEKYGHQKVDIAIGLTERIFQQREREKRESQSRQDQREKQLNKVNELRLKLLGTPNIAD